MPLIRGTKKTRQRRSRREPQISSAYRNARALEPESLGHDDGGYGTTHPLSRQLVGRLAAALFATAGLVTAGSIVLPAGPDMDEAGVAAVGMAAVASGILMWYLPWQKWPRQASLALVLPANILIPLHNYFSGFDSYRYGLFYLVAFTWVGVSHRRGMSLLLLPPMMLSYLAPLLLTDAPVWQLSSVLYAAPVCALVSEMLAWITERWRTVQVSLDQSGRRFRSLVQNASDLIIIVDEQGVIIYASPSVERFMGYQPKTLVGKNVLTLLHPDDLERAVAALERVIMNPGVHTPSEYRVRHADGSWRHVQSTANSLLDDPAVRGIVYNSRDVTEYKSLERELTRQAFEDSLTSLPNRALFFDRLDQALRRARSNSTGVTILFLDLDGFKNVNDSLGHAAGDTLLLAVGERLRNCLEPAQTAARLGGDEFGILLEDCSGGQAAKTAESVLTALRRSFYVAGRPITITGSIGIASFGLSAPTAADLLRNADIAMYTAKSKGKDNFELFQPQMHADLLKRIDTEAGLRAAIEEGRLVAHYQPIVEIPGGCIVGFEALVRWQDPVLGLIQPLDFVPLAEESGLILDLGRWVLNEACSRMAGWQAEFPSEPPLHISVNLSARQLQDGRLSAEVEQALKASGLVRGSLILEVTENMLVRDVAACLKSLGELKALGVKLAIDDFGTGYSSLSYLGSLPIDVLKIDKSFVDGLGRSERAAALTKVINDLAQSLNLISVAEGVEDEEQLRELVRLGTTLCQGFYFSEAVPAAEARELIIRRSFGAFELESEAA